MTLETIHITKIVNGGYGFARLVTGQVALVRQVLPNETVTLTTEETKKNYLFGRAQQIITEHPGRILPPCQYYGQCGGCDLQHCDYNTQLTLKRGIIEDLLGRQSNQMVRESLALLADPVPSPAVFGYRQRIRLQVGRHGIVGFHRYHSHDIIPIVKCMLASEAINTTLTALQVYEDGRRLCELSSEVEIQLNPQTGQTVCIFHFLRKIRPADTESARRFCCDAPEVERIFFIGTDFPITGPCFANGDTSSETLANTFSMHYPATVPAEKPFELCWEAGGFCQVNLAQNRNLIEIVVKFCRPSQTETVLDLYCGMGNFCIPLAMNAKEVFGIEGQGSAIRSAKINAANAGLTNTRFLKSPVHTACMEFAAKGHHFDCVVIDPPRQGAPGLAGQLSAITDKRLIYISCDPSTLCRDLADLSCEGFTLSKIQPVDMFPQTHHIETVVLLEKGRKPA